MSQQTIIVKGIGATKDKDGNLSLRVSDVDCVETVLVFSPALSRNLPGLIEVAPVNELR